MTAYSRNISWSYYFNKSLISLYLNLCHFIASLIHDIYFLHRSRHTPYALFRDTIFIYHHRYFKS